MELDAGPAVVVEAGSSPKWWVSGDPKNFFFYFQWLSKNERLQGPLLAWVMWTPDLLKGLL